VSAAIALRASAWAWMPALLGLCLLLPPAACWWCRRPARVAARARRDAPFLERAPLTTAEDIAFQQITASEEAR
jgi:hypothetical protein